MTSTSHGKKPKREPLFKFKRPRNVEQRSDDYLKCIYWPPKRKGSGYVCDLEWYKKIHRESLYDEPIEYLLSLKVPEFYEYVAEHHTDNAAFSRYYRSKSQLAPNYDQFEEHDIVYVPNSRLFARVYSKKESRKCYVFGGKPLRIASAFKLRVDGSTMRDTIIPIRSDTALINLGDDLQQFHTFYIQTLYRNDFEDAMLQSVTSQIKRARKEKLMAVRMRLMGDTYSNYISPLLDAFGVVVEKNGDVAKWKMSNEVASLVFKQEFFDVTDRYVDQLKFWMYTNTNKMTVKGVILVRKEGNVYGRDLLDPHF